MRPRKILFIGLGGAGQRHLRIFKGLLGDSCVYTCFRSHRTSPLLNPDFSVNDSGTVEDAYNLTSFDSLEAAFDDGPDLAVISTPSAMHFDAAMMAAEKGVNIFVEKPFSHNLEGFERFRDTVLANNVGFFISFQRRHHGLIGKAREAIVTGRLGDVFSASFNVASYVPAWHAYENFLGLYACRKELGGGVLLTEIHEFDLCNWFFGPPAAVSCTGGTLAGVAIDVEDTAHACLDYPGLAVSVNLCFMQRHGRRDFSVAGSKGYLEWNQDGNRLTIEDYETGEIENLADPGIINDDMFTVQAKHFLESGTATGSAENLEIARMSLAMVAAAKRSMETGRRIAVPTVS